MVQHHKYSIEEIENLVPFEREIYISLLKKLIKENENKK